jgi:hypothetical protein
VTETFFGRTYPKLRFLVFILKIQFDGESMVESVFVIEDPSDSRDPDSVDVAAAR